MTRFLFALALSIFLFAHAIFAQNATDKTTADDEATQKLRTDAVAFLRETISEINNLRTRENRLSFSSEAASIVWEYDEQEGRNMFANAAGELIEVIRELDQRLNTFEAADGNQNAVMDIFDPSDERITSTKMSRAFQVRQQLAMSIADHDPDLAYQFYYDSGNVLTNKKLVAQAQSRDMYFENQLLTRIAETDAKKAADLAMKAANKKFNFMHIELLKKIYSKEPEKAAEFASTILSKIKDDKDLPQYVLIDLFRFAESTIGSGKKPIYSQSDMRGLAEILAKSVLESEGSDDEGRGSGSALNIAETIEAYLPSRAAQIRSKFRASSGSGAGIGTGTGAGKGVTYSIDDQPPPPPKPSPTQVETVDPSELVKKLSDTQLPAEEREKAIAKAREIIAKTPGRQAKIMALGMLAGNVAKSGDTELADQIMRDAEALAPSQPVTISDYMLTFMVVSAYAEANPRKAFQMLDGMAYKANDLLESFVKVGEFVDITGQIVADGEVMTGAFGGSMVRGMAGDMAIARGPIRNLAKADFQRLAGITKRIDRPEIRVFLKMMVLNAVFEEFKEPVEEITTFDN